MGAFQTPVIYGLALGNNLSDLPDKDNALRSLGLEPTDLASIGNINEYMGRDGFQAISNLDEPIQRKLSRYNTDTIRHPEILNSGVDLKNINSNVTLNGAMASSTIRYYSLDSYDSTRDLFTPIDISTSRASSWSGFGDNLNYGAELRITNGGRLSAGTLKFNTSSEPKVFETSEVATHTIKTNINGKEYVLFAMRDIPLVFNGNFRTYDVRVGVNNTAIPVSSRVYLTDSKSEMRLFRNLIYSNSVATIAGVTPNLRPRTIEIYCDPRYLTILNISRLGVSDLPATRLTSLRSLNLSRNYFTELPNISGFAPQLTYLDISNNDLHKSNDLNLQTFTEKFVQRLPRVTTLVAGNTVNGRIQTIVENGETISVIEKYLPLTQLNLRRDTGSFFSGITPSVSSSCVIYNIQNNNFTEFPVRGLFRNFAENKISQFLINGNRDLCLTPQTSAAYLSGDNYSNALEIFNADITFLPVPNLTGKQNLREVYFNSSSRNYVWNANQHPMAAINSEFSLITKDGGYKFTNCDNLERLEFSWTVLVGRMPMITNPKLKRLSLHYCNLSAAVKPAGVTEDHSFYKGTFDSCRNTLESIGLWNVLSQDQQANPGNDYFTRPLQPGTFDNMPQLIYIHYVTYRTTGDTPNFTGCFKLKTVLMHVNAFTGLSFISRDCRNTLETIYLPYNQINGGDATRTIGTVTGILSLSKLFDGESPFNKVISIDLESNQLNGLVDIDKVPNLRTLNLSKNSMVGAIPDFSNTPNLQTLLLNNNRFSLFTPGAFNKLTKVKNINLLDNVENGNNTLPLSQIELIIDSLYLMFNNFSKKNNRNVTVYLASDSNPFIITSSLTIDKIDFMEKSGNYKFFGLVKQAAGGGAA